ncbi:MAG: hypothetical protein ACYCOO_01715 [Chitinophagaceae bacterium]
MEKDFQLISQINKFNPDGLIKIYHQINIALGVKIISSFGTK